MIILQNNRAISLPCGINDIKSFAVNHCDFYFLDRCGYKLIKWSLNTQGIETVELERKYLCICYDPKENCYWAVPECEPHLIYRLDTCFCKVGYIAIRGVYQQRAISLCCDCCGKGLWVCYPCQVAYVEKYGEYTALEKPVDNRRINLGLVTQCTCRVFCYYEDGRQIAEIMSECDGETLELCIPKECKIAGLAPCYCDHDGKNCRFYVLLSKVCSHEFVLMEYCINFSEGIMEPCCPCPVQPCCPCPPPHPSPSPCPCPPPHPCPPPYPPEPNCGGIYEVMHSIALEESGISHILNAEGEKIQKAVAISDNIEQLICVNESVKRTLTQVTLLEGMLYSKLEALLSYHDCCCTPEDPEPPCTSHCQPIPCCDFDDCRYDHNLCA